MKDNSNPRFTETGAKDHDPQQRANQLKSSDNVRTANTEGDRTPNYPHPGKAPEGKHSGGNSED